MWTLGQDQPVIPEYLYPLSDGHSISAAGSLEPTRLCSALWAPAVKPACTCALRTVADRSERTLRACYVWEATALIKLPAHGPPPDHGRGLDRRRDEGSIPRSAPPGLAPGLRSLLPILYAPSQRSMSSCSKGSRGLSVLPQVIRIFTNNTISPGVVETAPKSLRHSCRSELTRQFATLMLWKFPTAAVYWEAARLHMRLTHPRHNNPAPGGRQTLSRRLTALQRSCVFDKQSLGEFSLRPPAAQELVPSPPGALLLPKLRSQYAEFLYGSPDRLGMLYLPTCVGFGTGACVPSWGFLGGMGSPTSAQAFVSRLRICAPLISMRRSLRAFTGTSEPRSATLLRHPVGDSGAGGTGMSACCASATPLGLALLPTDPGRISLAQEPLGLRRRRFLAPLSRYSCQHSHFPALHRGRPLGFSAAGEAPTTNID